MPFSVSQTFRALKHRNYRLFFAGQGLSLIGTWLQQVAMSWLVYRLTGSAWLLGVVAFCANVGILLFGNLAGVLADRIDRRRALLATQSLMLVQAVVLAVLVAFGWTETWHLIVLALCGNSQERAVHEAAALSENLRWTRLRAVRDERVVAVDGSAYFSRPGPRIVDSLEMLAAIVHPELWPSRVQIGTKVHAAHY